MENSTIEILEPSTAKHGPQHAQNVQLKATILHVVADAPLAVNGVTGIRVQDGAPITPSNEVKANEAMKHSKLKIVQVQFMINCARLRV